MVTPPCCDEENTSKIEDVERAVSGSVDSKSSRFLEEGIANLPVRWDL